ncbi:MAG: nucleotidyltransferase domain-containing protein [Myxococcota bacterium]|nr:nucleotidyltransferase domain-containing protein [Myxococcota bacterium]
MRIRAILRSMVSVDIQAYVEAWRRRFCEAERAREERARTARSLLPLLAGHLVRQYGARRVWVFGSLAEGGFHDRSDIDLAVEGLSPGSALFRAGADLDDLARPFRVDLVPIEDARDEVRAHVLRHGEMIRDAG